MRMAFRVLGTALLIGGGVLAVATIVAAPRLLRAARPLVREGLKRGIDIYARARAGAAEFVEDVSDLVAEVQAELTSERAPKAPAAEAGPSPEAKSARR
jgi:hypothetical protein